MKSIPILSTIALLVVACTSPNPAPQLRVLSLASSGNSIVTLYGTALNPTQVSIGNSNAKVLAIEGSGSSVRVELPSLLAPGDYTVRLSNADAQTATGNLSVLASGDEIPVGEESLESSRNKFLLKGQATLAFKPSADQTRIKALIEAAGFRVDGFDPAQLPGGTGICAQTMAQLKDGDTTRSTVDGLNALMAQLEQLEPGVVFALNAKSVGNAPSFHSQVINQVSNTQPAQKMSQRSSLKPQAFSANIAEARIAVLDSGVSDHKLFTLSPGKNVIDFAAARNFSGEGRPNDVSDLATERTATGTTISSIRVGHGTAVAGLIVSTLQSQVASFANDAEKLLLPIKICDAFGRCKSSSVTLGICYAISQAKIKTINLSVGGAMPSSLVRSALEEAAQRGISVVTSSGNQGENPAKPANYPAFYGINLAGQHTAIPGLIAVGSVLDTAAGIVGSGFSSQGPWVDISAFGENQNAPSAFDNAATGKFTGTSFSAPQVAALAALLHAQNPSSTVSEIKQKIIANARVFPGCPANKCGIGLIDIGKSLAP